MPGETGIAVFVTTSVVLKRQVHAHATDATLFVSEHAVHRHVKHVVGALEVLEPQAPLELRTAAAHARRVVIVPNDFRIAAPQQVGNIASVVGIPKLVNQRNLIDR